MNDNEMPKVSVVIAVYNSEQYLRQCLNSIVGQKLRDIEIICVNDASTDMSLKILDEYMAHDWRVCVLNKENEGLGAAPARNLGLANARGKYISILDSDDFFESEMLEEMFNKAEQTDADIVLCGGTEYDNRTGRNGKVTSISILNKKVIPDKETFSYMDIPNDIFQLSQGMAWNKLYRRAFLDKHNLNFQKIRYTDDAYFSFAHMVLAERIAVVNKKFTHYRVNSGISQTDGLTRYPDSAYLPYVELKKSLEEWGVYDTVKQSFINCAAMFIRYFYDRLDKFEAFKYLHDKLKDEIFKALDIDDNPQKCFYDERLYLWVNLVTENSAEEIAFRAAKIYNPHMTTASLRFPFPFHLVERGKRIVIYGAGLVGRYYISQLLLSGYCDVALWVEYNGPEIDAAKDEDEIEYDIADAITDAIDLKRHPVRMIMPPESILTARYDKVFIAIASEKLKQRALRQLYELGIPAEKIICE
ncbi:MAG: glycosyltransferase [Synergistaceae bacterium]|jgi:glycosyltransferase involved in cell wall biosynthesis|nr:glycosyltransferase [Synergistaceae bacterium]